MFENNRVSGGIEVLTDIQGFEHRNFFVYEKTEILDSRMNKNTLFNNTLY